MNERHLTAVVVGLMVVIAGGVLALW